MRINQRGIDLIKSFEGLRLKAYQDSVGVWTIGFGQTGPDIKEGLTITPQTAEDMLHDALRSFEEGVSKSLGGAPTTDNQFAAMVSLAYNIGVGAFKSSSVLRYHRDSNSGRAAASFKLWNKAGGKVLAGLTRRREAERDLYLSK